MNFWNTALQTRLPLYHFQMLETKNANDNRKSNIELHQTTILFQVATNILHGNSGGKSARFGTPLLNALLRCKKRMDSKIEKYLTET
jgi:hypothetical protein